MAAPGSWGDEFLVNAVTVGAQLSPVVAALADGGFAIAYTDYSRSTAYGFTDRSDSAVRVQVFSSNGAAEGAPMQVNSVSQFFQHSPRIAALSNGGFVVSYTDLSAGWDSYNDDIWGEAVRMQRFDADGDKLGWETRVNTSVYGDQDHSNVSLLDDGSFIVTWDDGYSDADENVNAQLFDANGDFVGLEFTLNEDTAGSQTGTDIAALPGGGYVVTWVDGSGADGDGGGIFARIFATGGTPLTGDFQVNTTTTSDQYQPSVTALAGGGFFVVWTDNSRGAETGGDDTSSYALRGQLFDASGAPLGGEIRVNQTTTYGQVQPNVLALDDGRFIVAWSDTSMGLETGGDDGAFGAIRAQIFNADGSRSGDEFLVNATTEGHQNEPQMDQLADGRVIVTWTDYSYGVETGGDDADNGAIRARILDLSGTGPDGTGSGDGGNNGVGLDWIGTDANDAMIGTDWTDKLRGERGKDALSGGGGNDRLYGGASNDRLDGDDGDDMLRGNNGLDTLRGGNGNDRLFGGTGKDWLYGGSGDDLVDAGRGADRVHGGSGADTLSGGDGADIFVYRAETESGADTASTDTITDFAEGVDRIHLGKIDANPWTGGDDAFVFLGRSYFSGEPGEVRYVRGSKQSVIKIDIDGDTSADMKIVLTGWHTLDADDFIL